MPMIQDAQVANMQNPITYTPATWLNALPLRGVLTPRPANDFLRFSAAQQILVPLRRSGKRTRGRKRTGRDAVRRRSGAVSNLVRCNKYRHPKCGKCPHSIKHEAHDDEGIRPKCTEWLKCLADAKANIILDVRCEPVE